MWPSLNTASYGLNGLMQYCCRVHGDLVQMHIVKGGVTKAAAAVQAMPRS
jgi:hypothetical protein